MKSVRAVAGLTGLVVAGAVGLSGCAASVNEAAEAAKPTTGKHPTAKHSTAKPTAGKKLGDQQQLLPCDYSVAGSLMCIYVTLNSQVFTGPNQLGPSQYNLVNDTNSGGVLHGWWPQIWSNDNPVQMQFLPDASTFSDSAQYAGQSPLPDDDLVTMASEMPFSGSNTATCGQATYTWCQSGMQGDESIVHFWYTLTNFPVPIVIRNNLPGSLALQGSPTYSGFLPDPNGDGNSAGGSPGNLPQGATGYFGVYRAFQEANTFSATYVVENSSEFLNGTTFNLNLGIDETGAQSKTPGCTPEVSNPSDSVSCTVLLQGAPGGPQMFVVDIYQ